MGRWLILVSFLLILGKLSYFKFSCIPNIMILIELRPQEVLGARQVDLAPTLGLLTGIGVPEGNVGRPLSEVLQHIPPERRMTLQRQAARQLLAIAKGSGLHLNHGTKIVTT